MSAFLDFAILAGVASFIGACALYVRLADRMVSVRWTRNSSQSAWSRLASCSICCGRSSTPSDC